MKMRESKICKIAHLMKIDNVGDFTNARVHMLDFSYLVKWSYAAVATAPLKTMTLSQVFYKREKRTHATPYIVITKDDRYME